MEKANEAWSCHMTIMFSWHDGKRKAMYFKNGTEAESGITNKSKTRQQQIRKKMCYLLSDRVARDKIIANSVLLLNQSISIKQFNWLNMHFTQFNWKLFSGTCGIGNIFAILLTCLNIIRFYFSLQLMYRFWILSTFLKIKTYIQFIHRNIW